LTQPTIWEWLCCRLAVGLSKVFGAFSHLYFRSGSNVLLLSIYALDDLLSSESFFAGSEKILLRIQCKL
jgi:hypothetical protein